MIPWSFLNDSLVMTETHRSRTISRSGTPGLLRSSASKITVAPTLRPSPSLSNLHIHSYSNPNQATAHMDTTLLNVSPPRDHLDSSGSSVINMDPTEGLLIQDVDPDTDNEDLESIDKSWPPTSTSDSDRQKQVLREQLKKSLSQPVVLIGQQYIVQSNAQPISIKNHPDPIK